MLDDLRTKYREIITEAGGRDGALAETRVQKAINVCSLLFDEEEPDESKVTEAMTEADSVLTWLREQAIVKTEGGHKYPIQAYAYAPNKFASGSWQLRMWEDPEKGITKGQLSKAAAALSPGGMNGQRAKVSKDALPAVKRTLRAAYRKLGVETKDMPKWIVESETREHLSSYVPLTEAMIDKGRATVVVIKAGFNTSGDRYYPAEMLQRDCGIFEGAKMYADHPTAEEDKARPERSIRDWVATLSGVTCDENGTVTGVAEVIESWMLQKLASLRDKAMLSEMGVSIDAVGSASKGQIDGKETLIIERLVAARSVDFVTEPGAGGIVTFYEADKKKDIDLVDLSALRERRPDLIKAVEAEVRAELKQEVKQTMDYEAEIKDRDGQIETLTKERDGLKTQMEEAARIALIAETKAIVEKAVGEAELPDASKTRLIAQFADATSADGVKEAIKAEISYVAEIKESGKVQGLGASIPANEGDAAALRASLKMSNPTWTDEQLEVAVQG